MAVTLTSTLSAHQKGAGRVPSVSVVAEAKRFGAPVAAWDRVYAGTETDAPHGCCLAADGSLLRIRNDAGTVRVSRVASPAATSLGWSTWGTSWAAAATAGSGVAVAAYASEAIAVYTRGTTIYFRTSSDNGASWSAEGTVLAVGSTVTYLAVAYRASTGNVCVFYTVTTTVRRVRRTSGAWGAGATWTNSVAGLTGIGAVHTGTDFLVLASGTQVTTTHKRVWAFQLGDGGIPVDTWSGLVDVAEADTASTTTFNNPRVVQLPGPTYRAAYTAVVSSLVAVTRAYEVALVTGNAVTGVWGEPSPHGSQQANGYSLAGNSTTSVLWGCTANEVWRADFSGSLDVSGRVERVTADFWPERAALTLLLDNADGALSGYLPGVGTATPGGSGPPALLPLAPGCDLTVKGGYASGAGGAAEYGTSWTFNIEEVKGRWDSKAGRRLVEVRASGAWEAIARWRAPQAWQTAAAVLARSTIFSRVCSRAGVPSALGSAPYGASATWTAYSPSFALSPGQGGSSALQKLLEPVNDLAAGDRSGGGLTVRHRDVQEWAALLAELDPVSWWRPGEAGSPVRDYGKAAAHGTRSVSGLAAGGASPLATVAPAYACAFDGSAGDVNCGDHDRHSIVTTNAMSWVVLFRHDGTGGAYRTLFSKYDGATPEYDCLLAPGTAVEMYVRNTVPGNYLNAATGAVAAATWVLLVVTCNATSPRLEVWLDGVSSAVDTTSSGTMRGNTAVPFRIGSRADGLYFDGDIAEVAVFDRVLTSTEIARLQLAKGAALEHFENAGGNHPVYGLDGSGPEGPEANWVRLQGLDRYADRHDFGSLYLVGARRADNRQLDGYTDARTDDYATGAMRRAEAEGVEASELVVPWHAGLQLGDLVSFREANAGISWRRLGRVERLGLRYARGPEGARYDAVLGLVEP
jgi:hypothetical protein